MLGLGSGFSPLQPDIALDLHGETHGRWIGRMDEEYYHYT
jgi:hypothetical protein